MPNGAGEAAPDTFFDAVQANLQSAGYDVTQEPARAGSVRFCARKGGATWRCEVERSPSSASSLPAVKLIGNEQLLAHVDPYGVVCVDDSQGLSMDWNRPEAVVAETVQRALALLENSVADAASGHAEFFSELEGYWHHLPGVQVGISTLAVDHEDRPVSPYFDDRNPRWAFLERGGARPAELLLKNVRHHWGAYFALDAPFLPPPPGKTVDDAYLLGLVGLLNTQQRVLLDQVLQPQEHSKRRVGLLFSCPRPAGGRSLLGVGAYVCRRQFVPGSGVPITLKRHHPDYMRARGGALPELAGKHVAVVGCGSVGSEIADLLASSGVGKLTLVDDDLYSSDNVFRHVLGPEALWVNKAHALTLHLRQRYPGLIAHDEQVGVQTWWPPTAAGEALPDAVVLAVGSPTLERLQLEKMRADGYSGLVLVTWLEALDLGGHALLLPGHGKGCLECIYRDDDGQLSVVPRTAFLQPGQAVTRDLTGCAGAFVPYGAAHSRRTALEAAQLIMDGLLGTATAPQYRFWTGPGRLASAEGLNTTPWWAAAPSTPFHQATRSVFSPPCSRCKT